MLHSFTKLNFITVVLHTFVIRNAFGTSGTNSVNDDTDIDIYYPNEDWSDTFDWKLFKTFAASSKDNIIISPVTLKLILALLYEGAGGLTEKEFQNVLQFSIDKRTIRDEFFNILSSLQSHDYGDYTLNIGTKIFIDTSIHPQPDYIRKAIHFYHTGIESLRFSNPIEAVHRINSWVKQMTHGRIEEIVQRADIASTVMLIGNAVFFKGLWRTKFSKELTKLGGFYITARNTVTAPYIFTTDNFYYYESSDLDAKILRLPYKGKRYSMFLVLPNAKEGLQNLIRKINLYNMKQQLYSVDLAHVNVRIPKFQFNYQCKLVDTLKEYGLRQLFESSANLSGIFNTSVYINNNNHHQLPVSVSQIIQKAGIEVNEEGSVVYAATEVQIDNKFGEVTYNFNATHPFMFFVEDQTTGSILFIGTVQNPGGVLQTEVIDRIGNDDDADTPFNPVYSVPSPVHSFAASLQPINPERDSLERRFNYFDLELLYTFHSKPPKNVFLSSASIKTTLALLLEGAGGTCAEQIGYALRIDNIKQREVRDLLTSLVFNLNERSPNIALEAANALFIANGLRVSPSYSNHLQDYIGTSINTVDFSNSIRTANVINNWVANGTHGIIRDIVGPGDFGPETTLMVVNTVYFKGVWKTAFDPKSTQKKCFHTLTHGCVDTSIMQLSELLNYNLISDLNAYAIELPYQDDIYSMLILHPAGTNNIRYLVRDLQHSRFSTIVDSLQSTDLIFEMPKFDIEFTTDLSDTLQMMHITDLFNDDANLTGIVRDHQLKIGSVLHKAKVEVNEYGTKAAAASAAIVIPLMGSTAQRVIVDSPFAFFIYHTISRNIIFEGIYYGPTTSHAKVYRF